MHTEHISVSLCTLITSIGSSPGHISRSRRSCSISRYSTLLVTCICSEPFLSVTSHMTFHLQALVLFVQLRALVTVHHQDEHSISHSCPLFTFSSTIRGSFHLQSTNVTDSPAFFEFTCSKVQLERTANNCPACLR